MKKTTTYTFVVIFGVGLIILGLQLVKGRVKSNPRVSYNLYNYRTGPHQSNSQSSEATSERHFPTAHSKSANLPENASLTDEKNRDAPVYNGHRNIYYNVATIAISNYFATHSIHSLVVWVWV